MGSLRESRFLVVDAADNEKWAGAADDLFSKVLCEIQPLENETYEVVRPYAGERLPETVEEIQRYRGVIITGSGRSANDDLEWIEKISEMIRAIVRQEKTRLVAICFGHQLVARALGGRVSKQDVFTLQPERIFPSGELWLVNLGGASQLLLEAHGDNVSIAPPQADVLATSSTAAIESMAIRSGTGDGRVVAWTLQAHPEMPAPLFVDKVLPFVSERMENGGAGAQEKLLSFEPSDAYFIMSEMKKFLVSGWSITSPEQSVY
uniref:Glutamine amidotransferase domain-containing protein n=1 Tax=Rhodosorus marinus TaxID=101924 RepID=A0A7S2ZR61_9RHOD|mmetsp:Transcript_29467/g.114003  ORF Transcript_29467/g.114003 Transcript_29467/m.114003 type:complete len:263 (+) Transcript_29467:141-929(+)